MVQYRDLILKRQARESRKQNKLTFKRAVLVDEFGNQTSASPLEDVWAVESERRVWHMHEGAVQPAQILCRKVSDPYVGLGVIIGYAEGSNQLEVLSDDFFLTGTGDPTGWASTAPRDFEPGGLKQMWVYSKVITPLATYPGSGISVNVIGGDYPYLGTRKSYAGSVNFPLTSNPNAGEHYLAGLYLDSSNTLQVVYGASVVVATTPPEPSWPAGAFRLSAVRVNDTQTTIDFADDVFDRRMAWSDEISSSAGWPFANVLSVSTTDPDADYTTVTAAIAAASAGDGILLDMESSSETITVNKAIYLIGLARGGTIFTNSITITAAARLYNIKVTHDSVVNARGFICNQTDVAVLYNCEAVTNGSTTSRAIEQTNSGSTQVYGGYYESSGAGTSFEVFISAGSVILYNQPVLYTGAISGNAAGQYTNSGGDLVFVNGTGMSGGVWLYKTGGTRDYYTSLTLAAPAAGAGDIIHLFPGTYTLTSQLAYGAAFAIEGEGPETIINCATNSISLLLLNSAGAALRNLKITHSGAGILNSGVYITADATVENVTVTLSGAATANYPILQQGGTATLTNVNATASGATTNHAYRNDTGDATVTINGGRFSGTQADIYGERAGSTLNVYDPVLVNGYSDWDGDVSGQYFGTKLVTNTSGATALGRDVGYIDSSGDYVTTTTANTFTGSNCVVVISGGSTLKCFVATAGRWPVRYAGSAPNDGDFLVTSTTAGAAAAQATMRPEIFARCQAAGASNVVTALLLTGRKTVPFSSSNDLITISAVSTSDFVATQNGAPSGADITYNAPSSGAENTINPAVSTQLAKLLIHNTTRGTEAKLQATNTGTNVMTFTAAGDVSGWQNTDSLTARSQTNTDTISSGYFYDIAVTSSEISELATGLILFTAWTDTAASTAIRFHPYSAGAASARQPVTAQVANVQFTTVGNFVSLINRRFTLQWNANGSGSASFTIRCTGIAIATP